MEVQDGSDVIRRSEVQDNSDMNQRSEIQVTSEVNQRQEVEETSPPKHSPEKDSGIQNNLKTLKSKVSSEYQNPVVE